MTSPTKDPRPSLLKWRDTVAAVIAAVVSILIALDVVDPKSILVVLLSDDMITALSLLGGGAVAGFFAWLDRRFGHDVGRKLEAVSDGVISGREAAIELAQAKAAEADAAPKPVIGPDEATPIEGIDPHEKDAGD